MRERDRKADNVSGLVYISVSFVTAEQPTKSRKWRKWKKRSMKKQREINIKSKMVQVFGRVDAISDLFLS